MSNNKLNVLSNELLQAGAEPHEVVALTRLAEQLQTLKPAPSPGRKTTTAPLLWQRRLLRPLAAGCLGLALVIWLFVAAQTVLPGSRLYPVKRLSEQTAVTIDANYRATIMMRRAQEVQKLVDAHADSQTVLATLAAYKYEAAAYKTGSTNYSAFEYCKASLQQAETHATPVEQHALQSTLDGLQDV